ncbi:hypothetical protein BTHE68_41250 [Burkholderia sp. THE68]|nr:hypothetical protein BTHE68_41250 [Burkholderia sp. THE68]
MGDAIFSVREPTAVQDAPATGDAILNESTANWCRCILRGQAALGATQLRFAFETLPLSSFALNEPIKIGVLIEGIDATQEADWTRKLDDLRPRSASAHISFDVIGVDSLRSAKELVRTLSADALDAAFEAVMHS